MPFLIVVCFHDIAVGKDIAVAAAIAVIKVIGEKPQLANQRANTGSLAMRQDRRSVLDAVSFNHAGRNRGKSLVESRPAATVAYRVLWTLRTCIFFTVIYCEGTHCQRCIDAPEWPAVALAHDGRHQVTASPKSAGKTMKPSSARLCVALSTTARSLAVLHTACAGDVGDSGNHSRLTRYPGARIADCDQRYVTSLGRLKERITTLSEVAPGTIGWNG